MFHLTKNGSIAFSLGWYGHVYNKINELSEHLKNTHHIKVVKSIIKNKDICFEKHKE